MLITALPFYTVFRFKPEYYQIAKKKDCLIYITQQSFIIILLIYFSSITSIHPFPGSTGIF
jgi:hypothetical protein